MFGFDISKPLTHTLTIDLVVADEDEDSKIWSTERN